MSEETEQEQEQAQAQETPPKYFVYNGYGAIQTYPKWFKELNWYEAQLYSSHADVLVGGVLTRCELGDYVTIDEQGFLNVLTPKEFKKAQARL